MFFNVNAASTFGNPFQANRFLNNYANQFSKLSKNQVKVLNLGFARGLTSIGVCQLADHTFLLQNDDQCQMLYGNQIAMQIEEHLPMGNLNDNEPLTVQGLDSLLAIELSVGLKKQFGLVISELALLGGLSVKQIVESVSL
ncbi:unnamed protein product [Adineta steineri]|uniref:Carrier domain-containing protein n=1 Tax=Adineta steineri TaxID=433720 RepID=A0A816BUB9_9BILA|nr:unnamed protein product [Adineta steineri]CAF1614193.1 unnamed protein product [Adineta steineri]